MAFLLRNDASRYGWGAIVLHWAIALVFVGQFAFGVAMVRIPSQRTAFELIQLHKSVGFLLLGLVVLRIGWRLGNGSPALPPQVGAFERRVGPLVHFSLYVLQLAVPLSGWALVSVSMLEIPSVPFGLFVMPNLPLGLSDAAERFWTAAHWYLSYGAMVLVALHLLAALRHHFWLRDPVLVRMITPSASAKNRE
jgi:cytochrome b561